MGIGIAPATGQSSGNFALLILAAIGKTLCVSKIKQKKRSQSRTVTWVSNKSDVGHCVCEDCKALSLQFVRQHPQEYEHDPHEADNLQKQPDRATQDPFG